MKKTIISLIAVFAVLAIAPTEAKACIKALGFLDPVCVVTGKADVPVLPPLPSFNSDSDQTTINNYTTTNSNNTNSIISSNINTSNNTPTYNYDDNYYGGSSRPLSVSCYANPSYGFVGDTIIWRASVNGGTGNYNISWDGTNGLSGNGFSVSKRYSSTGMKNASVRVVSGSQSVTRNCGTTVDIRGDGRYYDYDDDYDYDYDNDYNESLYVSCSVDTSFAPVDREVTWRAYASGGNGSYRYEWEGTDRLDGSGRNLEVEYHSPGVKRAEVTVRSGGRTITRSCTNTVTIGERNDYGYNYSNTSGLQIACYPDRTSASIGAGVTWAVEAIGGSGNYSYSWTGTDGLSSGSSAVTKNYGSAGTKSASVTVTASNGQSATQACGSTVYIQGSSSGNGGAKVTKPTNGDDDEYNPYSAAALFSLEHVPWGWVIILVLLVLMGTIIYLLVSRNKVQ